MNLFKFIITLSLGVLLFACSDDDVLKPIALKNSNETTLRLNYPNNTEYYLSLQGGDGNYSVKSGNEKVVVAEMISSTDLSLKAVRIGQTTVIITDNSQNTLTLDIKVEYEMHNFVVEKHDIHIHGGDLTENEKKAIKEKHLAEIPVEVGGGCKFVLIDQPGGGYIGNATIYPNIFEVKGTATTFEILENSNTSITESAGWGYEITINNEKRFLVLGIYTPSTKATEPIIEALMEDITHKVQIEYPKAELVYTSQVIKTP